MGQVRPVGRARELEAVDGLVTGLRSGQGGVLLVLGEPGIGKTTLVEYAADRAASGGPGVGVGVDVVRINGSDAERDLPFAGLGQLLRPTVADLDRLPPPQAEALGVALALRTGPGVDRLAVGTAVLSLLTERSELAPVLVLVDDGHLLDQPTQEVLAFVGRRLLADAVVMIAAARSDEPCLLIAGDVPRLELAGLDDGATAELLAAGGGPVGTALGARVQRLTGGNPLAIRELADDPDKLRALPGVAPGPVPERLSRLYARRAAALDPSARTVLLVASAAGDDVGAVAAAARHLGLALGELAAAERVGLVVVRPDSVRFRHPLVRSAVYANADPAERRRVHEVLADVVTDPDRRAWHRYEAVIGPDDDVATELAALGDRAASRGAHTVAATAYERAAALTGDPTRRSAHLLAAAEASWDAGEVDRAQARLVDVTAGSSIGAVGGVVGARAERLRGVIAARTGSLVEAREAMARAAELTEVVEPARAVSSWAELVNVNFYLLDAGTAGRAADRIDRLLGTTSDPDERAIGLLASGMARVFAGERGSVPLVEAVAASAGAAAGLWPVLGRLFLRGADRTPPDPTLRSTVGVGELPHLLFHLGRDAATTDRWVAAEAAYTEAIELAGEFAQPTEVAIGSAGLAWLLARQGRLAEVEALATTAERLADRHEIPMATVWSRFARGDARLAVGDVAAAADVYADLEDRVLAGLDARDIDLSPVPELVDALLRTSVRTGALGRLPTLAAGYRRRAEAKGAPWALARAARVDALLTADADLDGAFGRALTLHRDAVDPFETACTQLAYGARLRRARRRTDARGPLTAAVETFARLGARPWADRAADELDATGATVRRTGDAPTAVLTARELQVAVLLAQGRTTRQAAQALFLSAKTVEYHLSHVYTKLGIGSRAELAATLTPVTPVDAPGYGVPAG